LFQNYTKRQEGVFSTFLDFFSRIFLVFVDITVVKKLLSSITVCNTVKNIYISKSLLFKSLRGGNFESSIIIVGKLRPIRIMSRLVQAQTV